MGYVSDFENEVSGYLNCGDKNYDNIDFWGANRKNVLCEGGKDTASTTLSTYPVPVFLSTYGCVASSQWNFSWIDDIYGQSLSPVWSGDVIYQYFAQSRTGLQYGKHLILSGRSSSS